MHPLPCQVPSKWFWKLRPFPLQNGSVKKRRGRIYSRVIPGTPKAMGPLYGKWDPYHSHFFRNSGLGVGLGNSILGMSSKSNIDEHVC